jgi:Fur family ferric uptake transcriptional regulator
MTFPSPSTFPLKGKRFVKATMNLLRSRLKVSHFKWGIQRERIVLAFLSHDHVSIRGLYALLNRNGHRTPVGTIYQTMRVLVKVGFARPRYFGDRAQYDNISVTGEHDHLVCTRCGQIVEFEHPVIVNLEQQIAVAHGFHLTARKLEVYGICPSCREGGTPRFS